VYPAKLINVSPANSDRMVLELLSGEECSGACESTIWLLSPKEFGTSSHALSSSESSTVPAMTVVASRLGVKENGSLTVSWYSFYDLHEVFVDCHKTELRTGFSITFSASCDRLNG
jgi:hypothetical protein